MDAALIVAQKQQSRFVQILKGASNFLIGKSGNDCLAQTVTAFQPFLANDRKALPLCPDAQILRHGPGQMLEQVAIESAPVANRKVNAGDR